MHPAGLQAFEQRAEDRSGIYSFEQRHDVALDEPSERQFCANEQAWAFFQAQVPSYRKAAIWWVKSAKKEETRRTRLARLIADAEQGRTIPPLTRRTRPA